MTQPASSSTAEDSPGAGPPTADPPGAALPSVGPRLILASASPRRQALMTEAGYRFEVVPSDVNEDAYPRDMMPSDFARGLAVAKADVVANQHPDAVVLAADTVVAFGDTILGKPTDARDALRMLSILSGTTHLVITGVAIMHRAAKLQLSARVMSAVRMKGLTRAQADAYVATNQWQGKAGGYGIQDRDPFVTRVSGCQTNIVGLPMTTTRKLLEQAGIVPTENTST
jgi:septum formation protein